MWLVCLPEADTGGQVAAVVGAALRDEAAGVTAAAIGERVGRVRVVLYCKHQSIVGFHLYKSMHHSLLCIYVT